MRQAAPQPVAADHPARPHRDGRLLNVSEAAERLGTGDRFIRRLIAERRIAFVKIGRHVRITESVLDAYVAANTVQPVTARGSRARARAGYRRAA